jgi:hypothetical protein
MCVGLNLSLRSKAMDGPTMKVFLRYVDRTYSVLLFGRSLFYLAAGLFLLVIAGSLAYAWIDSILLVIPALIAWEGSSLLLQALQPFAGKRPAQPHGGPGPDRRNDRQRAARLRRGSER